MILVADIDLCLLPYIFRLLFSLLKWSVYYTILCMSVNREALVKKTQYFKYYLPKIILTNLSILEKLTEVLN